MRYWSLCEYFGSWVYPRAAVSTFIDGELHKVIFFLRRLALCFSMPRVARSPTAKCSAGYRRRAQAGG
jgi:hypothetical protein